VLAACESRRDCSVKRRDEILSEKNEQKVSAMEGDEMDTTLSPLQFPIIILMPTFSEIVQTKRNLGNGLKLYKYCTYYIN